MKYVGMLLVAALLCGAAAVALAGGDVAKGETLSKGCTCHRSRGDLKGQDAAALLAKMQAFKAGQGSNRAMISIMKRYEPQDMANLAAYYASLSK